MAYYRGYQVQTAFGRPMSSRQGELPGLGLIFLLLLVGGVLALRVVIEVAGAEPSTTSGFSRMLGYGEPKRVQMGYVAPPAVPAEPAVEVASVTAAPFAAPAEAVSPAPVTAATPAPTNDRFRVANTDGLGVVLYTAPRRDARVPRGIMEGARVTVLERVGTEWARVRGENGLEGWVAAQYLVAVQ